MRLRTRSRRCIPSVDSRGMCLDVYCWRRSLNCCSVWLGEEESTIGRAGDTILPPTVTDSGGASAAVLGVVMVIYLVIYLLVPIAHTFLD